MNLNRRAFVAGTGGAIYAITRPGSLAASDGTSTPIAGPSQLDTGSVSLFGISPDGTKLVGRERGSLVFLDADTSEEISRVELGDVDRGFDETSLMWSPDGSKVAFSLQSWLQMIDSDIFIVDIATGELANITDEDGDEEPDSLFESDPQILDMYPTWIDDDTIGFYRHEGTLRNDGSNSSTLVTAGVDGAGIEPWADLTSHDIGTVFGPIRQVADGQVLIQADLASTKQTPIIASVDAQGTVNVLELGDGINHPLIQDANASHFLINDPETSETWYVPIDEPSAKQPLYEVMGFEQYKAMFFPTALGPEPGTFVTVQAASTSTVSIYDNGDIREISQLNGDESLRGIQWAGSRILLIGQESSWIIDLDI